MLYLSIAIQRNLVKGSSWFSLEVICIYNILAGVHNRFWSKDNITTNTFGYRCCLHISVQWETPKERRLDRVSITGCFNEGAYNTSPDQVTNLVVLSFRVSQKFSYKIYIMSTYKHYETG